MPRIFDNTSSISSKLSTALINTIPTHTSADFCVGYFNLRGWKLLQNHIAHWGGVKGNQCRILVGMQRLPREELSELFGLGSDDASIDRPTAVRLRRRIVDDFRRQLMVGAPTNDDEATLQILAQQLRDRKVVVRLFLRYPLHAKLYLLHKEDYNHPTVGFLGSSNLTFSGLSYQGELNTEITDSTACGQLTEWFDERWNDGFCLDISDDLIAIIEESWARTEPLSPYEVYLKMAYHLAQEARAGLSEFRLPKEFASQLFDYQAAAVQIAAHHLNKRGGVLLGDVVGLGKTLMATTLARIFQDDYSLETLILCPVNLVTMWEKYVADYRMIAEVIPTSQAMQRLPTLRRYRLVIIDESHNLRNQDGKRYRAIQDYITTNESRCILLSATPYNKSYKDLSAQLRLFIAEDQDIGVRPERYLAEVGEAHFINQHQVPTRSLAAFDRSEHADDWRELMRLYLVRRTRSFIMDNYAETDADTGRRFMTKNGVRNDFPSRVPLTVRLEHSHQYQRLYSDDLVTMVNVLRLPRYGLGQYVSPQAERYATDDEKKQIDNLSRAGQRLMGFSRTNLFKRLESSGSSFLLSLDRHILRNFVFLHAIDSDLPLPIGSLDADMLDSSVEDEDADSLKTAAESDGSGRMDDTGRMDDMTESVESSIAHSNAAYLQRAQEAYTLFSGRYSRRFKWLRSNLFMPTLKEALEHDIELLLKVQNLCGDWSVAQDNKLNALVALVSQKHADEKVLVFSQFADTVRYLHEAMAQRGVSQLAAATGQSDDPTRLAHRFSPVSNGVIVEPDDAIRVLLSTDVLSEGQNLQDSHIVVNYDLPWAIIRLSQRAGRVDRIGQQAEEILCYSFLPADGIEQIIRLRSRVSTRLAENSEVIGSDEQFFEEAQYEQQLRNLYTEKANILDMEIDTEVDLSSYAWQIWSNATKHNPTLEKRVAGLPDVVYATRHYTGSIERPQGVLTYIRTGDGSDALLWLDEHDRIVTESQFAILRAAACEPDEHGRERHPKHHRLVQAAVEMTQKDDFQVAYGGKLGRSNSPRRRAYDRLKAYLDGERVARPLLIFDELERAVDAIYLHPLRSNARDTLVRQMRVGVSDEDLAGLVLGLWRDDRLSLVREDEDGQQEPQILCSLGLFDM